MGKRKSAAKPPPKKVLNGPERRCLAPCRAYKQAPTLRHACNSKQGGGLDSRVSQVALQQWVCSAKQPLQLFLMLGWLLKLLHSCSFDSLAASTIKVPLHGIRCRTTQHQLSQHGGWYRALWCFSCVATLPRPSLGISRNSNHLFPHLRHRPTKLHISQRNQLHTG